ESFNGTNNKIPVAPGRSEVRVSLPEAVEGGAQRVLALDETFELVVDYESDVELDLATIGDGDVRLLGSPVQDGQLISTTISDGGLRVRATYRFSRDPFAYRGNHPHMYVNLEFPPRRVEDVEGNTHFGLASHAGFPKVVGLEERVSAGLLPLTRFSPALEAFRFRVLYRSEAALVADGISEGNHLMITSDRNAEDVPPYSWREPESEWRPVVTSVSELENGRCLEVDYRWDKPDEGWPLVAKMMLLAGGVRDEAGGSVVFRELGTVGRTDLFGSDVDSALIGGSVIEGDPETHRMSFLVPYLGNNQSITGGLSERGPFANATVWLGLHSGLMPVFDEDRERPVLGRENGLFRNLRYDSQVSYDSFYESLKDVDVWTDEHWAELARLNALQEAENITVLRSPKTVVHIDVPRPEGGWDSWGSAAVPYSFQAPGLEGLASSTIASGLIHLGGRPRSLPLLSNFEDWVRNLEKEAALPEGSLNGDADGDGQDSLAEFALGSDPGDRADLASIVTRALAKEGENHLQLEFTLRSNSFGLSAELQQSLDGRDWHSIEEAFDLVKRTPVGEGLVKVVLVSKEPMGVCGFFRIGVAR
ncbi:MAG: hypothetical protein AAF514_09775, partial [Verrucomicrobiota bacterium]